MKRINFTFLFCLVLAVSSAQKQDLKLPLTIHNGFSTHSNVFSTLNRTKELTDTSNIAKGLKYLTNLRMGSAEIYPTATTSIWDSSFRNTFGYIFGTDKNGKEQLIIDKNNNGDFTDDSVFVVDTQSLGSKIPLEKLSKVSVEYDWVESGKKVKQFINVHIAYNPKFNIYGYIFAQHATATLNGKKLEIIPSHDLSYNTFTVFDNEVSSTDGISPNKYLKDSNNVYRIKEIDINEKVLILEKEKKKFTEIESAQTGFRVPSFSEIDLISKEKVTLENYRGKYVFLDLWTTWCGPCIEEMPKLKVLYDKIDHSKIEFIGIVGQVNFERINKIINDIGINWKLVESTTENLLFNKFKVSHFPTTLLVDPNGIIIRSNIRAEELEKIIEKIP